MDCSRCERKNSCVYQFSPFFPIGEDGVWVIMYYTSTTKPELSENYKDKTVPSGGD